MRIKLSRKSRFVAVSAIMIAAIIVAIIQMLAPQPSVAAYCKRYKAENVAIAQNNSPKDLVKAYAKLEQVAPSAVKSDTITMRKIYQKIDSDPSQSFTASFSGLSAEANIESWVKTNCSH